MNTALSAEIDRLNQSGLVARAIDALTRAGIDAREYADPDYGAVYVHLPQVGTFPAVYNVDAVIGNALGVKSENHHGILTFGDRNGDHLRFEFAEDIGLDLPGAILSPESPGIHRALGGDE